MAKNKKYFNAIDLFSGCGGLSLGMQRAGFTVKAAVEIDRHAIEAYRLNHKGVHIIEKDIKNVSANEIKETLDGAPLHLLAGCPPCQGFSSVRRLNRTPAVHDDRNALIQEYFRLVESLRPITIMMENVPGLRDYTLFKDIVKRLEKIGYSVSVEVLNVKEFGVPQNRRRLIMLGSLRGKIDIAKQADSGKVTVRDIIENLELPEDSKDPLHKIVPKHTEKIKRRIELTPKDGGSWNQLPGEYTLDCHKKDNVGFNDIYGRLRWDDCSSTITGGCLNPSKGRFLHPEQDRVITPREAALLQSFPKKYKFPTTIPKQALALLIGNALPPEFSRYHSEVIIDHLEAHY